MSEPRIKTRCPSCGHDTLFVPEHGLLTCSWIGCTNPAAINDVAVDIVNAVKELRSASRALTDLTAQNQARGKEIERLHAEIVTLRADAAKDAEMIAELADYVEKTCSSPAKVFGLGLALVDGKWRRVK